MITLLITLVVIGFVVWLLTTYIPMEPMFRSIILVVAVLVALFVVMRAFGIVDVPIR